MVPAHPPTIDDAVERLRQGGLVAFPTETVYGLGADALNPDAVDRVYQTKGRPPANPLIVHAADPGMALTCAAEWPRDAAILADAFWPGPLTLVVPRAPHLPARVTAGGPTVALRCPDHPVALDLIRAFGGPLVGPSANPSGDVSPTEADHVRRAFPPEIVMVLDGGPCRGGIESTVVLLDGLTRKVLRPGLISAEQLASALHRHVVPFSPAQATAPGPLASPGLLDRHYAPKAPAWRFTPDQWPDVLDRLLDEDGIAVVLTQAPRSLPSPHTRIVMPTDAKNYAARLYAALREADATGPAWIAVEWPPAGVESDPIWDAVGDRLRRATAPFE